MRRIKLALTLMRKPRAISLFSGCGGSDLALLRAGFEIVWSNDIWDVACATNRINLQSPNVTEGDIRKFSDFPKAELLVGCYPCQGYSQGGRAETLWNLSIFSIRNLTAFSGLCAPEHLWSRT